MRFKHSITTINLRYQQINIVEGPTDTAVITIGRLGTAHIIAIDFP